MGWEGVEVPEADVVVVAEEEVPGVVVGKVRW